ncbi:hypothetical protein WMY93_016562 [Mugilogobius chulae]|uniref:L1 transposable element RRM domain-containing protein n=1 Tax=Mugilogobius chulae TaxID=88201 RepID=A0AAW0NVX0_9GOBI
MAGERTLESLFQAIQDSKNEVIGRLGTIDQSVNRLDNAMGSLVEQFTEIQQRVSKTEDDICDAEKRVKDLEKSVAQLQSKVDYLENKSRQSNLLILGVPELSEGTDCTAFVQRLIPELLGRENFIEPLRVERCHRIGDRQRAEVRRRPRPLIMKLLSYQDKVKILHHARMRGNLSFQDKRVYIFPDFSEAVQEKRKAFLPVKRKLQKLGIRYIMHFPAILSFTHQGKYQRFNTPAEAELYIGLQDQVSEPPSPMD